VKAYLKRSKNDANDAAAICEAVTRPSMRFVPTKSEQQQSGLMRTPPARAAFFGRVIHEKRAR
jgi:transposase